MSLFLLLLFNFPNTYTLHIVFVIFTLDSLNVDICIVAGGGTTIFHRKKVQSCVIDWILSCEFNWEYTFGFM